MTRWLDTIEPTRTDRWIVGWWLLNLAVFSHVVVFTTPLWLTYFYNGFLYFVGAIVAYRWTRVRNVFVLGTVAGALELGVDHFLVEVTGTLVYPSGLPMLVSSPLYMPLAWAIVTTHLGYIGLRLADAFGRKAAAAGPAVLAVLLIGFYEYGAFHAGIWEYVDAPLFMLGHVPFYIVAAEGIMFATLYEFVRIERPVVAGIGFAAVISVSYVGTYLLFAGVVGAL
jgi:hypothetical protein